MLRNNSSCKYLPSFIFRRKYNNSPSAHRTTRALYALIIINMLFIGINPVHALESKKWEPVHISFDSIAHKMEELNVRDPQFMVYLNQLNTIADSSGIPILKYRCYYWEAVAQRNQTNQLDSVMLEKLNNALLHIDTSVYLFDYARIRFLLLSPTNSNSDFIEKYKIYNDMLALFEKTGDLRYQGNTNRWLGILMAELDEPELALNYLQTANKLYQEAGATYLMQTNQINLSVTYQKLGQLDKTIEILETLAADSAVSTDTIVLIAVYSNLFNLKPEGPQKDAYNMEAHRLARLYRKNSYQYYLTLINLGGYYLKTNQTDSAFSGFFEAYDFAKKNNISRFMAPVLEGLARTCAQQGKWQDAYAYQEKYIQVKDSISGIDKISAINKMESGLAIKEYQNQLIIEQQKNELNRKQTLLTIILLSSFLLIGVFILLTIWQKNRITASRLRNEELENKSLQQEIDLRNRELSATSLILSEKNGILNSIVSQMEKFRKNGDMTKPCETTLKKMISSNLQSENEWESFKIHFEKVHPDFFSKLKERYPELSENELKLCAYIRIGMTPKQISQMISVLPNTIKTNRYLVRKKMKLQTKDSLDEHIRSI